ncbi:MAG: sigma-54-dependent Fis family transcriptional regulator [Desulfobacterales bacterium]|nr:sigma-54-dependent Fis family transcriptional regulator [Desulfobacterales bacterium]
MKNGTKTDICYYESIVNGFSGFIYAVSKEFKIEFMNQTMIDHLGFDATGSDCFNALHGLKEPCSWCAAPTVLNGEISRFEYKSPRDDRWYYHVSTPKKNADGKIEGQLLIAIDIHDRKEKETAPVTLEQDLKQENIILKSAAISRYGLDKLVGHSYRMQELYNLILEVASSDASVLIYGESGTGKELTAQAIHNLGIKKKHPFLPVNCGGIPDNLVESEFFGYKKGAFTGAHIDKSGFLQIADKGTLFLDEIGEINLNMQVKLLRVIDGDGYTPLGGNEIIKPNIRIISATNRDLKRLVSAGRMRSDFFYRINVIPIYLPPLRERPEDISLLIYHFLKKFSRSGRMPYIPPNIMNALEGYNWPGNIRELQNIIHRYVALNRLDVFEPYITNDLDSTPGKEFFPEMPCGLPEKPFQIKQALRDYERQLILHSLRSFKGNQSRTADNLGMNRKTLYSKIKALKIEMSEIYPR